jgi:hypothetical protein
MIPDQKPGEQASGPAAHPDEAKALKWNFHS